MSMFSDRLMECGSGPGDRLLERIKVHHHQINRCDAVFAGSGFVLFIAANEQQAPVGPWGANTVLTRPSSISGKPCVVADVFGRYAGLTQHFGRAG